MKSFNYENKLLYPYLELPKNYKLKERSKELRKAGNLAEVIFWKYFKNKLGYDIDRQVIVGNYIVDFIIQELGLIIEIDGLIHDFNKEYDSDRDVFMQSYDLHVIRITDNDVKNNINKVHNLLISEIKIREDYLKSKYLKE